MKKCICSPSTPLYPPPPGFRASNCKLGCEDLFLVFGRHRDASSPNSLLHDVSVGLFNPMPTILFYIQC